MTLGLSTAIKPLTQPASAAETTDGEYVPLWAAPLLETKTGIGTPGNAVQKVPANGTMTFQALGWGGLPGSGVSAAALNINAITPAGTGTLSIYPSDKPNTVSTVAFTANESTTGADFTQITTTGQVTVKNNSANPVDVLISVDGYFQSGGAAKSIYKPLTTKVLWDTRAPYATGTPVQTTPLAPWSSTDIQVAGQVGIPGECDQSAAVALNIVALEQTADGELKVEPTDAPIGVSTLRYTQNDWNNSTFSIVQMSCSGKLRVTNGGPGTVNVSISVRGYFTYWDADDRGARYKPVDTTTILDTAAGIGTGGATAKLNGESHLVFDATGPSSVPVNTVAAAALQIKIIGPTQPGWITLRPEDHAEIPISSLVYQAGEDASGFDTQIPSGLGRIAITNHGTGAVHVQISVRGYYVHKVIEVLDGQDAIGTTPSKPYQNAVAADAVDDRASGSDTLGPSSYDPVTGTVITTATTQAGLAQAGQAVQVPATVPDVGVGDGSIDPVVLADGQEAGDPTTSPPAETTITVTPHAVLAPNDSASLEAIKDEVLSLDATQLTGADAIKAAFVEPGKNRVIVEADSAPAGLIDGLTTRYGPSKVALVNQPGLTPPVELGCPSWTQPGTRECVGLGTGWKPRGGARIYKYPQHRNACTLGFTWKVGNNFYGLTAGHCNAIYRQEVYSSYELPQGLVDNSNWDPDTKSSIKRNPNCCTPRSYRYSGDLTFFRLGGGVKDAVAEIFTGAPNSPKRNTVVGSATNHRAQVGEPLCLSGAETGSSCGWVVSKRSEGWKNGVQEVVEAKKRWGQCPNRGDSGGPVYTVTANGGIYARGIFHGGNKAGGADNCIMYFTNIAEARWLGSGDVYGK